MSTGTARKHGKLEKSTTHLISEKLGIYVFSFSTPDGGFLMLQTKLFERALWTNQSPLLREMEFGKAFVRIGTTLLAIIAKYGALVNEHSCVRNCWGVYEQNSIVNSCRCKWLTGRVIKNSLSFCLSLCFHYYLSAELQIVILEVWRFIIQQIKKWSRQILNYQSAVFSHKKSAELRIAILLNAADL